MTCLMQEKYSVRTVIYFRLSFPIFIFSRNFFILFLFGLLANMPDPVTKVDNAEHLSPFEAYLDKMGFIKQQYSMQNITPHAAVQEVYRIANDVVVQFSVHSLCISSVTALVSSNPNDSIQASLQRLRDGELITVEHSSVIEELNALAQWVSISSSRNITHEKTNYMIESIYDFIETIHRNYVNAISNTPQTRCSTHKFCSVISPQTFSKTVIIDHENIPYGWTEDAFESQCAPIHNTAVLDLQTTEDGEIEKSKEAESSRLEKLREWKLAKQKRYQTELKNKAKEEAKNLEKSKSKDDEDEDEGEVEAAAEETNETEEAEEPVDSNDSNDPQSLSFVPPPPVKPCIPFTFCCISCHAVLLSAKDIHRVYGNLVYTKPEQKISTVTVNAAEIWEARPCEPDPGMEESEEADEDKEEGSAKSLSYNSTSIYCKKCVAYLGRYIPSKQQYRLIYINRNTGLNVMYHTSEASVSKLLPLIVADPEVDETEGNPEENDEDAPVVPKQIVIPPIVGIPTSYKLIEQASLYPYPRFGALTPYTPQQYNPLQLIQTSSLQPTTSTNVTAASSTISTSGIFPIMSIDFVWSLLKLSPDPTYALRASNSMQAKSDIATMLLTDRTFIERRLVDILTQKCHTLFKSFPIKQYEDVRNPPIPPYTDFFVSPPNFTHCRGTARYLFHYLTGKDDSQCKRIKYSYDKLMNAFNKNSCVACHFTVGGYGGHRLIIVKVGNSYRIFQSNECVDLPEKKFTCLQWIESNHSWSRCLSAKRFNIWMTKFERARRGAVAEWEELFTLDEKVQSVFDKQDSWVAEDVCFSMAKLLDFSMVPALKIDKSTNLSTEPSLNELEL